jgi:hypothetical protein
MANTVAQQEIKEITVSAVVIRKDGTREDHGVIARYDKDDSTKNIGQVAFKRLKGLLNG